MQPKIDLLDVIALTEDLPKRNLYRGQVGTVVEFLGEKPSGPLRDRVFEVEFSDEENRTYASLALEERQLMVLYFQQLKVA
ncbi:MAG: DUF4926 domain-containing protein [Okeania sp. SIO2H7]|nr:DUF4926 domain-containing protein [Okeania sp. SIO2H7]